MRRHTLALIGGAVVALGSAVWLGAAWWARVPTAAPIVVDVAYVDRLDTLHSGEPVEALLRRDGVPRAEVWRAVAAAPELDPRRVLAGQVFDVRYLLGGDTPVRIATRLDDRRLLRLTRDEGGAWRGVVEAVLWTVEQRRVGGTIGNSLYEALHQAVADSVLPRREVDRFIADLADQVFGWEIDFSRDLGEGDGFQLVYERLTSSLDDVRYGRLLAARVSTRGAANRAYVMPGDDGRNAYYDDRGISLRRAFKRSPVAYLRISSRFSLHRLHPVLGLWRAHRGTDYSARYGTEIYATGDGLVKFAGRNGGYGLMVTLRHVRGIETRYAHMSRIRRGIATGVRVRQGDVIGYVGSTGLASGPHVHYEFLENGQQQNPRTVDRGDGLPIPEAHRAEFATLRGRYDRLLEPGGGQRVAIDDQ